MICNLIVLNFCIYCCNSVEYLNRSRLSVGHGKYSHSQQMVLTPAYRTLFLDQAIKLDEPCSSSYETAILSKRL